MQLQLQKEPKVPLRIGIHVGELFFEETKVMGDSVNVASRIQSLACANSILFSKEVFDKLKNQPEYKSVSLGKFEFKNVDEPLEIFALTTEGLIVPKREQLSGKLKEIKKKSTTKKIIVSPRFLLILLITGFLNLQKTHNNTRVLQEENQSLFFHLKIPEPIVVKNTQQNRQLAAILFTDIVGYTAMMQEDQQNALAVTRYYIAALEQRRNISWKNFK